MSKNPIFDKVLIANRGEIACRVMRTCRRLGIKTVAVYSTADEQSKHVRMADEAICIGPPASRDSYLRIDAVIDAAIKTKANAVHPGYGFLSENPAFSAGLAKAGIIFIGPDAPSIEAMGDKIHSKQLAKEAGVSVIPGHIGYITDHQALLDFAHEVGYPVMVKASAGGGGKGMRVAFNDQQCVEYYDMCRAEAMSAFGNDRMHVEKFIENPRHIEIQVLADRRGNTLYFPERECSIQRRNQKVVEEAPSTLIDAATRKSMGEQAAAMARKVSYVTAGTVEMVVNPKRDFYFLEMNTRLQVEHPITELITGVDLVEQMIRAAAGLELSIKQEDIKINGWATEVRVYAEDPMKNFFPQIGRLTQYEEPTGKNIRVDSGIVEGSQISVYYDPIIAKLCTWGRDRNECLETMRGALDRYVIRGLRHNICLLRDVIGQEKYLAGDITTSYLPQQYPDGFKKSVISEEQKMKLFAVSAIVDFLRDLNEARLASGMKQDEPQATSSVFFVGFPEFRGKQASQKLLVAIEGPPADSVFTVVFDATQTSLKLKVTWGTEMPLIQVETLAGGPAQTEYYQYHSSDDVTLHIQYFGSVFNVDVLTEAQAAAIVHMRPPQLGTSQLELTSPMPGVIVDMVVKPGDVVVAGTELLTLEAMKMRNKIRSEIDGVVKSVRVSLGQTVGDGDILVEFEEKAKA